VAQSGLWDVAGIGLEKAPPDVAQALLDKTNRFNLATGLKAIAFTAAFAASALLDPSI
jgi:hypothetical protein